MSFRHPFMGSWIPKVAGGVMSISAVVAATTKNEETRVRWIYAGAVGAALVAACRQDNVPSENVKNLKNRVPDENSENSSKANPSPPRVD